MAGVGMPQHLLLQEFGSQVWAAFGSPPYHVGSSMRERAWRDVDVRLILNDEEYARLELGDPRYPLWNARWVALVRAFSALGHEMTGLPIDFQIQQQSLVNEQFPSPDHPRSALGLVPHRKSLLPDVDALAMVEAAEEDADA